MTGRQRKCLRERERWVRVRYIVRAALAKPGAQERLYRAVIAIAGKGDAR